MTYKALYRFYRPQIFQDVAGQKHIVTTLQNAIREKRMGHAYIFAGPRGTGKTTIAKIVAKGLNCQEENAPCGECPSCISISNGQHPDVIEIDAASNNGVDEVRDLIDKIKYAPIQGIYKVYIIDEVHMMTTGAFNALLKTLEEPPAHAIFILATTEPHKIIPTILSRCQRFDFQKVSKDDMVERLVYVMNQENKQYDIDALRLITKLADGGMRDSLSILEQCLAYQDKLEIQTINKIYGLLSIDKKILFIKNILSNNMKEVLNTLENMLSGGIDIKRLTFDLIDILKDVIIYKNTNDSSILFVLDKSDIDLIVPYITIEDSFIIIDNFVEASLQYPAAIDAAIYFELAILKICNTINISDDNHNKKTEDTQITNLQEEINTDTNINAVIEEELLTPVEDNNLNNEDTYHEEIFNDLVEIEEKEIIDDRPQTPVYKEVKTSDVINILVQANHGTIEDIKEKWPILSKYRVNLNTAKYATKLYLSMPVAACDNAFIITFDHAPEANEVNRSDLYHELKIFIKDVLGKEYDYIALETSKWIDIRNEFIQLKKTNKLPEPMAIQLQHIDEYIEQKNKYTVAQQNALDMFGNDIVEIEE